MAEIPLTTVLLADDHTMFREGLAGLLSSYGGLEVVGETTNDQARRGHHAGPDAPGDHVVLV